VGIGWLVFLLMVNSELDIAVPFFVTSTTVHGLVEQQLPLELQLTSWGLPLMLTVGGDMHMLDSPCS
jgi:hypothetical protein